VLERHARVRAPLVKAAFLERLLARVGAMRIGDPMDPATQVGALISEQHMHKVLSTSRAAAPRARGC
jgi:acyl-CoA reductase-like NAD-dependent aldehyde dehydrogenase